MEKPEGRSVTALSAFVQGALSPDLPPVNPIRVKGWAGLAFDRNLHEYLAPAHIWAALLVVHATSAADTRVATISAGQPDSDVMPGYIAPSLEALKQYLLEDARFLRDQFLCSPAENWLARLDQDVTLIAGERALIQEVVDMAGGLQAVMAAMIEDFDAEQVGPPGLRRYLASITAPLAETKAIRE